MKLVLQLTAAAALVGAAQSPPAQIAHPHIAIDTWRALPGQRDRYLAFLDSNWVPARAAVARSGEVLDHRAIVLDSAAARGAGWDVMLMTTYRDSATWARREEIFAPVLAKRGLVRIDGFGPRQLAAFVWESNGRSTRGRER